MYTSLLIEKDPVYAEQLAGLLKKSQLFAHCHVSLSGIDGLLNFTKFPYDIIFVSLPLSDISGLDLIRTMSNLQVCIIVISDTVEEAVSCYELGVVDFLKRGFSYERLIVSINRAFNALNRQSNRIQPPDQNIVQTEKSHFFKIGRKIEYFSLDDIIYLEGYGVYCKVHLEKSYVISNIRLSQLASELRNKGFIRVHKSFIVNTSKIKRIDSRYVSLLNELKIPIGAKYRVVIKSFMESFVPGQKQPKVKAPSLNVV
ncbi:MAG: response regulator transcription factor [Spirosoma sp.]|uniref:LytR/AlgR family response regulator transcription factor n=1 Tax=Spirosoma sp. TaxID=1899569 RepID=UPI001AC3152A|nr:LytTR family DNA-binding domain-containing protein [Spirosoma sp.]MBN8820503.1 response regulator transcription factor [Spirosoma sp.]